MEPKIPETMEERMQAIEIEFKFFKDDIETGNASMCQDIEEALRVGRQNEQAIIQLPGVVIKAIRDENRNKGLNVNSWIGMVCTVIMCLIGIAVFLAPKLGGN